MDFRSLNCFVSVAELGSISRAADQLAIVQPAVSRHIQRLEKELGVTLLFRLPRGVQLTPAGRLFLEKARDILNRVEDARKEVATVAAAPRGTLVIGLPGSLAPVVIPACLERFRTALPDLSIQVVEGPTALLYERLVSGRLDLAILSNPQTTKLLTVHAFCAEPIVVVTPPHMLGERLSCAFAELASQPLWLTTGLHSIVDAQLRQVGFKTLVAAEIDSVETIRRLLLRGSGMTLMPVSIVRDDVESGRLSAYALVDVSLFRVLVLARNRRRKGRAAADQVAAILRQETDTLVRQGIFNVTPG